MNAEIAQDAIDRLRIAVAVDGGSGAGKTLLGAELARLVNSAVASMDDFCGVGIPDEEWLTAAPSERASRIIDWKRLAETQSSHCSPVFRSTTKRTPIPSRSPMGQL